jgi:hypothetical protein
MAKRPTSRSKVTNPAQPAAPKAKKKKTAVEPSVDDIRRRAFERYLERGGGHGSHFDDWLEAEKELKSKK